MEFAPVLPAELYPALDGGKYHLVQAHLIHKNRRILEWCRSRVTFGHTLILDNGAAELGEANIKSLISVAKWIRPSIIIAPDVFGDRRRTYMNFISTVSMMHSLAPMVMAVAHGRDVTDSIDCFISMRDHWIHRGYDPKDLCIGAPKLLDTYMNDGRYWFIDSIVKGYGWPQHRIHLLGINSGLHELDTIMKDFPHISGIDSTLPCAVGLHSAYLNPLYSPPKCVLTKQQWKITEADVDPGQWSAIKDNIEYCKEYVNGA